MSQYLASSPTIFASGTSTLVLAAALHLRRMHRTTIIEACACLLWLQVGARGVARQPLPPVLLHCLNAVRCGNRFGELPSLMSWPKPIMPSHCAMQCIMQGHCSGPVHMLYAAVVGFCIMMWPFLFHAGMEVVEVPRKLRAKKAI